MCYNLRYKRLIIINQVAVKYIIVTFRKLMDVFRYDVLNKLEFLITRCKSYAFFFINLLCHQLIYTYICAVDLETVSFNGRYLISFHISHAFSFYFYVHRRIRACKKHTVLYICKFSRRTMTFRFSYHVRLRLQQDRSVPAPLHLRPV